jgi:hypothetical protein
VTITTVADTDDTSVHSASTSGTSVKLSQTGSTYRRAREEAEVLESKNRQGAYATFPSELSADLLNSAAITCSCAESTTQDAARFRQQGKRQPC